MIESLLKVNPYKRLTVKDLLSEKYSHWFEDARLEEQE